MKRSTKVIIFIGIPVMAMLGNLEASKMYIKSHWMLTPISDLEIGINAIMVGSVTLLATIVGFLLQYVFQHFFVYIYKKYKQKK